jgi:hypothetical protein
MEFYTEKQALEIAINSVGATLNYVNEVSSEVSGETIKTIAHGSISKPSTFEIEKQIEAVRGLIEAHTALFDNSIKKLVTFDNENAVEKHVAAMNTLSSSIVALNETLRPYGGVEKLA